MKKPKLRMYPKLKDFANGSWTYNPIIDEYQLDIWEDCIARYTFCIAELMEIRKPLGNMISMRARVARFLARDRKLLLAFRKKNK